MILSGSCLTNTRFTFLKGQYVIAKAALPSNGLTEKVSELSLKCFCLLFYSPYSLIPVASQAIRQMEKRY